MRRLVFFSYSFPSGIGERWKFEDICVFSKYFDEVLILPLIESERKNKFEFPQNVRVLKPVFAQGESKPKAFGKVLECFSLGKRWILELIWRVVSGRVTTARILLGSIFIAKRTIDSLSQNVSVDDDSTENYIIFFWGVNGAESIPFIRGKFQKIVVCFHNFDLYKERAVGGYFPLRRKVLEQSDVIAPCSKNGAHYLNSHYRLSAKKVLIKRLGVVDFGIGQGSGDKILRVTSCALANPIKRLDQICLALSMCSCTLEWTHIGDGPLLKELKHLANKHLSPKGNVRFRFTGFMDPQEVRRHYAENFHDLFISLSSLEGIPVSIMEAMSAGIPVFATNVGGVSELVDATVGELLPPDVAPETVARLIDEFAKKSSIEREISREAARTRIESMWRAPMVNEVFAQDVFRRS